MASVLRSSTERALGLPEILASMLDFLHDDQNSLFNAALVSRLWSKYATKVLWREATPQALVSVAEDRRQLYAREIFCLEFAGPVEGVYHAMFENLAFSALRSVSIDTFRPLDASLRLAQYLHFPLQRFSFYGGRLAEDILSILRERCPKLKLLILHNIGTDLGSARLVPLLQGQKHLVEVHLSYSCMRPSPGVLIQLANQPKLEILKLIGRPLSLSTPRVVIDNVALAFSRLTSLSMSFSNDLQSWSSLLSRCGYLRHLDLHMTHPHDGQVVQQVSRLSSVQKLALYFESTITITGGDILALQGLTGLRSLTIGDNESVEIDMNDATFESLVKALPLLEDLHLEASTFLSSISLISLGKACRFLRECELSGFFLLRPLADVERSLFPCLLELNLSNAMYDLVPVQLPGGVPAVNNGPAEGTRFSENVLRFVRLLRRHAPMLEDLELDDHDSPEFTAFYELP